MSGTKREVTITLTESEYETVKQFEEITGISPRSLVREAFAGGLERAEEFIEAAEGYSVDPGKESGFDE
jgi:hypothetical protein